MAKRISEKQKNEIIEDFLNKKTVEEISEKFSFTKLTIVRNLKKILGEKKYSDLLNNFRSDKNISIFNSNQDQSNERANETFEASHEESYAENSFLEIAPLDFDIDKNPQKDLSSISISEVDLPKIVYMVVDKNTELEPKLLKEYSEWSFLSEQDLNRKTIEIFFDLKIAKRSCSREQKVIKVPNSNVFKITAPKLISQGISRIVSAQLLIAL